MFIKLIYIVPFLMALTACIYTTTAFARGDNYLNTSAHHVVATQGHLEAGSQFDCANLRWKYMHPNSWADYCAR